MMIMMMIVSVTMIIVIIIAVVVLINAYFMSIRKYPIDRKITTKIFRKMCIWEYPLREKMSVECPSRNAAMILVSHTEQL
jgi:hypothetical protein